MSVTSEIEDKGIKIEDLNAVEQATYFTMLAAVQESQLSLEKLKDYILSMKDAVEQELVNAEVGTRQDVYLKARLKNYMLLEAFLLSPERARKALDNAVSKVTGE